MTAPLVHASYVEIIRDTPLRDAPTIPAGTVGYVLEEIETYPVRYRVRWPGLDAPSVHAPDDLRPSTESEWQAGIAAKGTTPHTPPAALAGAVRAYLAAVDAHRAEKTRWQREYIPAEGVQRARIAEALAVVGTKRTALDAALATTTTTPKESR